MRKGVAIITLAAVPPRVVAMATGLRTPSDNGVSRPYDSAAHTILLVFIYNGICVNIYYIASAVCVCVHSRIEKRPGIISGLETC